MILRKNDVILITKFITFIMEKNKNCEMFLPCNIFENQITNSSC